MDDMAQCLCMVAHKVMFSAVVVVNVLGRKRGWGRDH